MKILIIGFGSIGQRHYRNLFNKFPKYEYYVLRIKKQTPYLDKNNIISKNFKKNFIEINSLKKAKDLKPKIVLICNPTSLHIRYAIQFALVKSNIFLEKPISNNTNDLNKLDSIIKKNKINFMIGYHLRFNNCLKFIKNSLQNNTIGDICFANIILGDRLTNFHEYEDYSKSYASKKKLGGGVVLSQSHAIDYALYLFKNPIEVFSSGGKLSNLKIDVEDTSLSILKFQNKKNTFPVSISLDYLQWPSKRYCKIVGTIGSIEWLYDKNEVITRNYKTKKTTVKKYKKLDRDTMYLKEISYFINGVINNNTIYPDFKEGKNVLKVSLAIKESMQKNKLIKIKL